MITNTDIFVIKILMERIFVGDLNVDEAIERLKEYINTQSEENKDLFNNI